VSARSVANTNAGPAFDWEDRLAAATKGLEVFDLRVLRPREAEVYETLAYDTFTVLLPGGKAKAHLSLENRQGVQGVVKHVSPKLLTAGRHVSRSRKKKVSAVVP